MKKKILEVQNYFADKLARGLYKVERMDEYVVTAIVDREFRFSLWISNGTDYFRTYNRGDNFMIVKFTEAQKKTGFRIAKKHHQAWVDTEKKEKDLAQLRRLQEKYPDAK